MENNRKKRKNSIINPHQHIPFIFSDVLYCKKCNRNLVGSSSRKYNKDKSIRQYYSYYRCKSCGFIINSKIVENSIYNIIEECLNVDSSIINDSVKKAINAEKEHKQELRNKLTGTKKKLQKLDKEKDNLIKALGNATNKQLITDLNNKVDDLLSMEKMYIDQVDILEDMIDGVIDYDHEIHQVISNVKNYSHFKDLSPKQKRETIQILFSSIKVEKGKLHIEYRGNKEDIDVNLVQKTSNTSQLTTIQTTIIYDITTNKIDDIKIA